MAEMVNHGRGRRQSSQEVTVMIAVSASQVTDTSAISRFFNPAPEKGRL
jgi:hypothetical protein